MFTLKSHFLIFFAALFTLNVSGQCIKFNHDYSKTLVMKLGLSIPDGKGGSKVFCNFETALELIEQADQLTLQVPKIIYLVGWQYNGHDDRYPAMFAVNERLKRPQDANARESLLWLMREARKYHTTISLHINMTDAYDNSPLWQTYLENDLISKTKFGSLMVIGNYNNRMAYQINYKNEWNAGWTQKRIDSLIQLLPELQNAGTIHIDAWIARESKGHYESLVTESEYQKKALNYWKEKGIDVTSEWVMDYMTGLVPFAWHFNARNQEQYLEVPAKIYTGGGINPDVAGSDFDLGFLFGQSMYGEGLWPTWQKNEEDKKNWDKRFASKFYLNCLQFFYLNTLERITVTGKGKERVAKFSNSVQVSLKDSIVSKQNVVFRERNTLFFPVVWKEETMLAAYSYEGSKNKLISLPGAWKYFNELDVSEVSIHGLKHDKQIKVEEGTIRLDLNKGQPYILRPAPKR